MLLAIVLFVVMYILLLIFSEKRWLIALGFAGVFLVTGILPIDKALPAINWNILMMLAGTMVLVKLFIDSRMPLRMAEQILKVTPDVQWAIVALSMFSFSSSVINFKIGPTISLFSPTFIQARPFAPFSIANSVSSS